jgi:hypothetical protein
MAEFGKRTKREARALAQGGKEGTEVMYCIYYTVSLQRVSVNILHIAWYCVINSLRYDSSYDILTVTIALLMLLCITTVGYGSSR